MEEDRILYSAWLCVRLARERVDALQQIREDLQAALDHTSDAVVQSYTRLRDSGYEMSAWWYRPRV